MKRLLVFSTLVIVALLGTHSAQADADLLFSCKYLAKQLDYSKRAFPVDEDKSQRLNYPIRDVLSGLVEECGESVDQGSLRQQLESSVKEQWGSDDAPLTVFILSFRWCGPCRRHFRDYAKLAKKYEFAKFVFIDGDVYGDDTKFNEFVEGLTKGKAGSYPSFYIGDSEGKLITSLSGWGGLGSTLKKLRKEFEP